MAPFDFYYHDDNTATLVDTGGQTAGRLEGLFKSLRGRSAHYGGLISSSTHRGSIALLGSIPATDKLIYRTKLAEESLLGFGPENFVIDFSSGSTSRPVPRYCRSVDDLSEQEATERAFRRAGIRNGDRVVFVDVGTAQIYDFYARAARNLGATEITYLHLTSDFDAMLMALRELCPSVLLTIPSLLASADKRLEEVWRLGGSPVRCLISTGEAMPDRLRYRIKQAWGCRVMSLYGTTETGCLASECESEDGHHFDVAAHVLTLRRVSKVNPVILEGELLMTTTQMYTQAVVKYAVGDIVRVSIAPCACGDPTPRIWHLRRIQDELIFAGEKFDYGMILDSLRTVAPDLESLTLEIEDVPEGPEHIALRAVIPDALYAERPALLDVLRGGIFELDSLVRARLVRVDVECRPSAKNANHARKSIHVIDRRALVNDEQTRLGEPHRIRDGPVAVP